MGQQFYRNTHRHHHRTNPFSRLQKSTSILFPNKKAISPFHRQFHFESSDPSITIKHVHSCRNRFKCDISIISFECVSNAIFFTKESDCCSFLFLLFVFRFFCLYDVLFFSIICPATIKDQHWCSMRLLSYTKHTNTHNSTHRLLSFGSDRNREKQRKK